MNRIFHGYTSGSNWGEAYAIDAWGNLTNIGSYLNKTNHELLNAAPANTQNRLPGFGYDAAGNMVSNGSATYTYDGENRLTATATYTYTYDGDGKRVKKLNGSTGTMYWTGIGNDTMAESSATGTNLQEYVYFNALRVARHDVAANSVHYYFGNHLGSASVVTNSTGSPPFDQDIDYYPYGGEIDIANGAPQNYRFTGKERDGESTLDNFGARYNSSSVGRFMSPDPSPNGVAIKDPKSWNLYTYTRNRPTRTQMALS